MYRFADERLARELLGRGVILWVNAEGKTKNKDEAYGLRYGGSSEIQSALEETAGQWPGGLPDGSQEGRQPPPRPAGPDRMRTHADQLTRIRLGVKETVEQGTDAEPAAASAVADQGFCYELRIPIADIGGKAAAQAPFESRKIAVGIQIGGLTEAEAEAAEGAPPDMPGGGGPPPGDSGGGRGGWAVWVAWVAWRGSTDGRPAWRRPRRDGEARQTGDHLADGRPGTDSLRARTPSDASCLPARRASAADPG
jgi:hypothetical protein